MVIGDVVVGNAVDAEDLSAALIDTQMDEHGGEEAGSEDKVAEVTTTMQDIWMDFPVLCKCFK